MTLPPEGFEPPQMPQHREASSGPVEEPRETSDELASHAEKPPHPIGRIIALAVTATLVVVAIIVAVVLWGPGSPVNTPETPAPSSVGPTPGTTVELPESFETYTLDPLSVSAPPLEPGDDLVTATGTYAQNGIPMIVVTAARPADNVEDYLLSLGASKVDKKANGYCGRYQEVDICGVQSEDTVFTVSPLSDQPADELIVIAERVSEA
ncbi:hypothetical protein ACQBAR_17615 [Propionibacteriaceae bacterium Y1685]|uniref:hypothetical protein n=1 Tax=Microlunatus sp. Y1700 TaxID=3418487 RepID=UPI003B78B3C2